MEDRIAPAIIKLLTTVCPGRAPNGRGSPPRHAKDEVKRAIVRLSVTGRLVRPSTSTASRHCRSRTRAEPRRATTARQQAYFPNYRSREILRNACPPFVLLAAISHTFPLMEKKWECFGAGLLRLRSLR